MARSEARISVDIWNDADFRALSRDAQWAFMFLLSQHDLAHDGVLALRIRRWSQCADGTKPDGMIGFLEELERARFIVVDYDAEELLVRSFIRRDKVYKQPNVLRAAADHLPLVTSARLRYALAVELERVSVEPMPDGSVSVLAEMRKGLPNPSENPFPPPTSWEAGACSQTGHRSTDPDGSNEETAGREPPGNPSGKGIGNPSAGTPGERGVVTEVEMASPYPVPRDPRTPDPTENVPFSDAKPRAKSRTKRVASQLPADFDITGDMRLWAKQRMPTVDVDHQTEMFVNHWRGTGKAMANWHATWRNWILRAPQFGPTARAPNGLVEHNGRQLKPETAARLADNARFQAMDAQQLALEGPAP